MCRLIVRFGLLVLVLATGCSSVPEISVCSDADARSAEMVNLAFFARRQLPEGDFPGTSRLLSTALALRCFLEAGVTPDDREFGRTVSAGLDCLVRQVERNAPLVREDDAVELRVAVWTLVLAFGETSHPNLLLGIRAGVARLEKWNGRTVFSRKHTVDDEYERMGMESLIVLGMRGAGIDCRRSVFAESLERTVRGVDHREWFNHVASIRTAFSVYGIDPLEEALAKGEMILGMTRCCVPPTEMSIDHYRMVERLCKAYEPQAGARRPVEQDGLSRDLQRQNDASVRTFAITGLQHLDRSEKDVIREAALLVLEMPRPWGARTFRRPFPPLEVKL